MKREANPCKERKPHDVHDWDGRHGTPFTCPGVAKVA